MSVHDFADWVGPRACGWSVPSEKSSREGKRSAMSLGWIFFLCICRESKKEIEWQRDVFGRLTTSGGELKERGRER